MEASRIDHRARSPRPLLRLGGALVAILAVAGAGAPACSDGGSAPPGEGETEAIGHAAQAVGQPQTCVTIQRALASGTVYDTQIANKSPFTTNYGMSGT